MEWSSYKMSTKTNTTKTKINTAIATILKQTIKQKTT